MSTAFTSRFADLAGSAVADGPESYTRAVPSPGPTPLQPLVMALRRADRPVRRHLRPAPRRPSRHRRQCPPRPPSRHRDPDGRQHPLAEAGGAGDHPGRRPLGDGRRGRRRRPRPGCRTPRDRCRWAELHRRHAGDAGPPASPAPNCSRSSATTPPPACTPGSGSRRSSPNRRWWSSIGPARRSQLADDVALDPCRSPPPRGVQHRPAGTVQRRPPARLPAHRPGAQRDRASARVLYADGLRAAAADAGRRAHRRRMTTTRAIVASVVGLAIAAGVGAAGYVAIANTTDGEVVGGGTPEVTFPATPTATLAVVDDDGDLASLAVARRPARRRRPTPARGGRSSRYRSAPTPRAASGPNARRSTRPWRCSGPSRSPTRCRSCSESGSTS